MLPAPARMQPLSEALEASPLRRNEEDMRLSSPQRPGKEKGAGRGQMRQDDGTPRQPGHTTANQRTSFSKQGRHVFKSEMEDTGLRARVRQLLRGVATKPHERFVAA